jgi:hypothetical protein
VGPALADPVPARPAESATAAAMTDLTQHPAQCTRSSAEADARGCAEVTMRSVVVSAELDRSARGASDTLGTRLRETRGITPPATR